MFSAAAVAVRLLLLSASVVYVLYKFWRSGRQTESSPNSGDNGVVPPHSVVRPKSSKNDVVPSDGYLAIVQEILKNDHVFLNKIRTLDPAVLDKLLKFDPVALDKLLRIEPAVLRDSALLDPAIIDAICELSEKEEGDEEADWSCSRPVTESSLVIGVPTNSGNNDVVPSNSGNNDVVPPNSGDNDVVPPPELSDRDCTILEEILKDNHVLLDKILALEPAFLDRLRKIKPAVLREMVFDPAELDPVIVDAIRKLSLKGGKEEGEENENGNVNETKSEERDEERSRIHHYRVRFEAGDCWCYLKTGTCKFVPNCKFNHPRITTKNNRNSFRSGGRRPNLYTTPNHGNDNVFPPNPRDPDHENGNGNETQSEERDKERSRIHHYPVRFEDGDCWSYLKTGTCNFGPSCKFNHPCRRKNRKNNQNYFRSGGCKPRNAFSFNPRRGEPSVAPVQKLNFMDLPIRPGEKECPYYMKNGSCKSATNCTFNHPDPTTIGESGPPSGYIDGGPAPVQGASSSTAWDSLCVPMIPPSQGIPSQNTEWNGSQDPEYLPERSIPAPPPYVMNKAVTETNIYEQNPQQKQVEEFPEQPGQHICNYFLRKGDCKHRSNCKYHHPKNQTAVSPSCALSDKGLPLRPGENICAQYSSYGICNSGPACKFDHPSLSTFLL